MNFAITGDRGKRLKVQLRIGGNERHADAVPIALCNECFEELFWWQSYLGSNRFSCEIIWIHFVFPQFISDSHLIQEAGSVSFLGHCRFYLDSHAMVCSCLSFSNASAANCLVNSPAGSPRPRRAAWPDHSGLKSADPAVSNFARSGATAAVARGNIGTTSDIGPTSRTKRFTIARAGRPVNIFVIAVSLSLAPFNA